jgi:hypothetical protein
MIDAAEALWRSRRGPLRRWRLLRLGARLLRSSLTWLPRLGLRLLRWRLAWLPRLSLRLLRFVLVLPPWLLPLLFRLRRLRHVFIRDPRTSHFDHRTVLSVYRFDREVLVR